MPPIEQQIKPELAEPIQNKNDKCIPVKIKIEKSENTNLKTNTQNKRKLTINDNEDKCSQTLKKLIVEKNQCVEPYTEPAVVNTAYVLKCEFTDNLRTKTTKNPEQVGVIVETNSKVQKNEIVINKDTGMTQCPEESIMEPNSEQVDIVNSTVKKNKRAIKKIKEDEKKQKLKKLAADLSEQNNSSANIFVFPNEIPQYKMERPTNTTIELFSKESRWIDHNAIKGVECMDVKKKVDDLAVIPEVATSHVVELSSQWAEQVYAVVKDEIENNQVEKVESDGKIHQTIHESDAVKLVITNVNEMKHDIDKTKQADIVEKKEVADIIVKKEVADVVIKKQIDDVAAKKNVADVIVKKEVAGVVIVNEEVEEKMDPTIRIVNDSLS